MTNRSTNPPQPGADATVLSVAELNREARRLLEAGLRNLWVCGEISNLARPRSGHIYFSLKDDSAQIRCAMFRGAQRSLRFTPEDGVEVLVRGSVSIYEARGDYQIIVTEMEEAGRGQLQREFEQLKSKLAAEGLFAATRKQLLPVLPMTIGVVTSATGAALRDILKVLHRRHPLARVIVYPTLVQGEQAGAQIAAAIATADRRAECDVLIVARGGGSLEDLWGFNTEAVARALFACELPVVAGIGHEVDITIADLVADVRAPTPSGAAELVAPDLQVLTRDIVALRRRGALAIRRQLAVNASTQRELTGRLKRVSPGALLLQLEQRCDELSRRLQRTLQNSVSLRVSTVGQLTQRLRRAAPRRHIQLLEQRRMQARARLSGAVQRRIATARQNLAGTVGKLHAVSPLATLERGYAIAQDDTGKVVTDSRAVRAGDPIEVRLARGSLLANVTASKPPPDSA